MLHIKKTNKNKIKWKSYTYTDIDDRSTRGKQCAQTETYADPHKYIQIQNAHAHMREELELRKHHQMHYGNIAFRETSTLVKPEGGWSQPKVHVLDTGLLLITYTSVIINWPDNKLYWFQSLPAKTIIWSKHLWTFKGYCATLFSVERGCYGAHSQNK